MRNKSYVSVSAICNQTCLNGGECVAPGQCQCRRGYMGSSCELDLDECTSDVHNCHESSQCVNMPGWYYCRCRPGFRSLPNHYSALGAICQGIAILLSSNMKLYVVIVKCLHRIKNTADNKCKINDIYFIDINILCK